MATFPSERLRARLALDGARVAAHDGVRAAAVLVPILVHDSLETSEVLFIMRPSSMPTHGGQVAFPGGGLRPDEDVVAAALRETDEELGIPTHVPQVIGRLDDLVTHTDFVISPVVALLPPNVSMTPSPREVDGLFTVPIARLMDPARIRTARGRRRIPGPEGRLHFWVDEPHVIWGATGHMLAGLLAALR